MANDRHHEATADALGRMGQTMADRERQQYESLMVEYKELRGEVTAYSHRIDRTIGIYLSALFALLGFLLTPQGNFSLPTYIQAVQASATLTGVFLLIGLLNCLLLTRIQSFYLAVLALSQYTATVTAPRVSAIVRTPVLTWDDPEATEAKRYWLPVRTVAQSGFAVLAIALSAFVSWGAFPPTLTQGWVVAGLYALLVAGLGYNVYVFVRIIQAGLNFHQNAEFHKFARRIALERGDA